MGKKHKRDPDDWLIKRRRNGREHITNCKDGFKRKGFWQSHHVLPISSLADANIDVSDENLPFIRDCLAISDWNTNAAPNLIGLPLKPVYLAFPPSRHPDDLPCHQIDHPAFTKGVCGYLKDNIWDTLIETRAECEFEVTDIVSLLEEGSAHWKSWLTSRGSEHGGTKECWQKRNDSNMVDKWYIPFSMDPGTPPKRTPPAKIDGAWKKIFDIIR